MKFKINQQVLCVAKNAWADVNNLMVLSGPKYNEECIVKSYHHNLTFIKVEGYPDYYDENEFEPLVSIDIINEQLKDIEQPELV